MVLRHAGASKGRRSRRPRERKCRKPLFRPVRSWQRGGVRYVAGALVVTSDQHDGEPHAHAPMTWNWQRKGGIVTVTKQDSTRRRSQSHHRLASGRRAIGARGGAEVRRHRRWSIPRCGRSRTAPEDPRCGVQDDRATGRNVEPTRASHRHRDREHVGRVREERERKSRSSHGSARTEPKMIGEVRVGGRDHRGSRGSRQGRSNPRSSCR